MLAVLCIFVAGTSACSINRGADKSLARPGWTGVNFLRRLALQEKILDDSSRLDVVEPLTRMSTRSTS